jgi:DNA-binding transcriptional MerR regulator
MLTISKLGKKFGLSRATILYYEREGLLEPASRAANGYRWYGDREIERLKQITGFRSYGVPVRDIRELLARDSGQAHDQILRKRFAQMETEIQDLRRQQQALLAILDQAPESPQPPMSKERWSGIMRAAGMSDEDMRNWHREFEAREPLAHQEFLESLNLNADEIKRIRGWSLEWSAVGDNKILARKRPEIW